VQRVKTKSKIKIFWRHEVAGKAVIYVIITAGKAAIAAVITVDKVTTAGKAAITAVIIIVKLLQLVKLLYLQLL